MADTAVLNITRSVPADPSSWGEVWLSQDKPAGALPTAIDLAAQLSHILSDGSAVQSHTGLDATGGYSTTVYLACSPANLALRYGVGPGSIVSETRSTKLTSQLISFAMTDSVVLSWPPDAIVDMKWQGVCYDADGNTTSPPAVTVDGDSLSLAEAVYGTLMLTYTTTIRTIRISTARVLGRSTCYFYAAWSGGVKVLEIPISSVASDTISDGDINWDVTLNFGPGDDGNDSPPNAEKDDQTIELDYCSQEEE